MKRKIHSKRKVINVGEDVYNNFKIYCENHGYKIGKLVEMLLLKHITSKENETHDN